MRAIRKIIIHCSDSNWGDAAVIRSWHTDPKPKGRGWSHIGYHYVIKNCYPDYLSWKKKQPHPYTDGEIDKCLAPSIPGYHVKGHNFDSIGICLIGVRAFTGMQLLTLRGLLIELLVSYPDAKIKGHYQYSSVKTCPNIDMDYLREWLKMM